MSSAIPAASAEAPSDSGEHKLTQRIDPPLGFAPTLPSSPSRNLTEVLEPLTTREVGPTQASEVERPNQTVRIPSELDRKREPSTEAMPEAPAMAAPAPTPEAAPAPSPAPAPGVAAPRKPEPVHARPRVPVFASKKLRWIAGGGVAAMLAAAAVGVIVVRSHYKNKSDATAQGWQGKVDKIASATGKTSGGLQVCAPDGKSCADVAEPLPFPRVRCSSRTGARARELTLDDGTELALDRGTDSRAFGGRQDAPRQAGSRHASSLDVAHIEGKTARIDVPRGWVAVLGTKLSVTSDGDSTTVDVSRGSVKLGTTGSQGAGACRRGRPELRRHSALREAAPALGDSIAWSESAQAEGEQEVAVRGLGELKAKKPGDNDGARRRGDAHESHAVKVRIAGNVARTEVDETFTNDTDEELEGIYRFPLPPDAQDRAARARGRRQAGRRRVRRSRRPPPSGAARS